MDKRKAKQLEKSGFDKIWLKDVVENFHPKRKGKYTMKIYDMERIDQEPDSGIYIETTCFDNERELSIIHHFFEGLGYVMTATETEEIIGQGIIDGSPFEEVDEEEGLPYGTWRWLQGIELNSWYEYNKNKTVATTERDALSLLRNRLAEVRSKRLYGDVVGSAIEEELEMLIDTIKKWEES